MNLEYVSPGFINCSKELEDTVALQIDPSVYLDKQFPTTISSSGSP